MGGAKRQMEEDDERGWSSVGAKTTCDSHVEEPALLKLLRAGANATNCSYCDRTANEPFAIDVDILVERVAESLGAEWGKADDEGVGWDHGYTYPTHDSYDLITNDGLFSHVDLISDVARALPDHAWVERDFARLRRADRIVVNWEAFTHVVKHERRYFFAIPGADSEVHDPDWLTPAELLDEIGRTILEAGLVRSLPVAGTTLHRLREHSFHEEPTSAAELGAAPPEHASASGRMNPAGFSFFYAALDPDTAEAEARSAYSDARAFTRGSFALRRPALIVDLAQPLEVPSLYDADHRHKRSAILFLQQFNTEVSEPFEHDRRIHIEYVPTQVVAEWLRTQFDTGEDRRLDGIMYSSARRPEGQNVVLFVGNDGAIDPGDDNPSSDALLVLREHKRIT